MSAAELRLSHFSNHRISRIDPLRLPERGGAYKPQGFWVSVDGPNSWDEWCVSEEYNLSRLAIRHRVTLARNANVMHIASVDDLDDFSERYGIADRGIDWPSLRATHDGIIIAPYQWDRRLTLSWYYGWDCASGCIWNLDAIASIEIVEDLMRDMTHETMPGAEPKASQP